MQPFVTQLWEFHLNKTSRLYGACENYEVEKLRHNEQINLYNQDSSFFKQSCPRQNSNPRHFILLDLETTEEI
jgi:hypothetical protein